MTETKTFGKFFGVGVGPGQQSLLPLLAVQALQDCQTILCPKAKSATYSVAKQSVSGLGIDEKCFETIEYSMEEDRASAQQNYLTLAKHIASRLEQGANVAYLTIGDALTYSTYSYTVVALQDLLPNLEVTTFPGITAYTALAAKFNWPLGQRKERLLILPCPESAEELRLDIESHDIVVLMKIGKRLPMVLAVVEELAIANNCVFGSRLGLEGEVTTNLSDLITRQKDLSSESTVSTADLDKESAIEKSGYLSTMLIRKHPPEQAWLTPPLAADKQECAV